MPDSLRAIEDCHQARLQLIATRLAADGRDDLIRRSKMLGLTITEIAVLIGLSRQHVSGIANAGKREGQ
jgi:CRP-like cAMP-binding protein